MTPYRAVPNDGGNPTISFGAERRAKRQWRAGLFIIALNTVFLACVALSGARPGFKIHSSVLLPFIFGGMLLARARWGSIELSRERQELVVRWIRFWSRKQISIPLDDLVGVTVVPTRLKEENPDFELQLALRGGRSITLLRESAWQGFGSPMVRLEPDRVLVSAFVLEHRLLSQERIRVPALPVEATEEAVGSSDADSSPSNRRRQG